ncbi:hypothetical protein HCU66_08320 [Pseudomonas frederiksbergensis]|uniref:hypothetical protein n=1 Tax=Pseudomonas frederiksbergensis TaxID=104087 RepID=UPI001980FA48|nr:hypothetical protein [Pseudomonas frederiksbergensis]MBN3862229.1 hypothetical protein [Pseudomonas frederiksbergensis]
MPSYKVVPALSIFYSDSNFPAEKEIGLDPKDPNNVAYKKYNKPFAQYQFLGGCNLKISKNSIVIQSGDQLDYYGDNLTAGNTAASFQYAHTFQSYGAGVSQEHLIMVGMPALNMLGLGLIEFYGSLTSTSTNTVYVFSSSFITIV